jgi:hypothetical protein
MVVLRPVFGWVRGFISCAGVALLGMFLSPDGLRLAAAFAATEAGRLAEARGRFFMGAGMVGGL